jgi:DNA-binding IclR family transcriptional regulator
MTEQTTGTVARAMLLLRALAEADDDVSVAALATGLGLPRPTVHRLVNLLCQQGIAEPRPDGRYGIGPELARVAALVTKRRSLTELALPMLRAAVAQCGETCVLGVYLPAHAAMTFAAEVPSMHPLGYRIPIDTMIPVVWGASGLAILAHRPDAELDSVLARAEPSPTLGLPVPTRDELEARLAEVRKRGFAYSQGEKIPDSRGIAAPVRGASGLSVACLVLTIPRVRYRAAKLAQLGRLVIDQADRVSSLLGYEAGPPSGDRTT